MDIEAPVRERVRRILEPFFFCEEEVTLETADGRKRADILAVTREFCGKEVVFAIEVKSHDNSDPGKFKDSLFQASKYVDARVVDNRYASSRLPLRVDAALVFPAPAYVWLGQISDNDGKAHINTGLAFFAERLNVGRLVPRNKDWEIVFGPNDIWSMKKGWKSEAKNRFPSKGIQSYVDVQNSIDSIDF